MSVTKHQSVLCNEVIESLRCAQGGYYLDCTLGGGGHSAAMLQAHPSTRVCAIDRDERAIARAKLRFTSQERIELHHAPFSRVGEICRGRQFDGILADLGLSTDQLWEQRGFSLNDSESLDMRMGVGADQTAEELLNSVGEQDLFVLLKQGGVGSEARAIAKGIVRNRPLSSARQLAEIVVQSAPPSRRSDGERKSVHPATVILQAIRIAVNQEFREIEQLLATVPALARPGGRVAVISFHSLEEKLVAHQMRRWEQGGEFSAADPSSWKNRAGSKGTMITKKAILPSEGEVAQNPSARSARLRVFEFSAGSVSH